MEKEMRKAEAREAGMRAEAGEATERNQLIEEILQLQAGLKGSQK